MLNKDRWTLGMVIGFLLPMVVYCLIILILYPFGYVDNMIYTLNPAMAPLLAVFSNLLVFRYYMVTKKYERTGRGLLLVTFLMALAVFYFFF